MIRAPHLLFAAALALAACSGGSHPLPAQGTTGSGTTAGTPPTYVVGATDFVSQAPSYRGGSLANAGGEDGTSGGATGGTSGATSGGTSGSSSGSAPRDIVEADIYKVAGNTLYVLNQYRGLQIVDVTDLAHPQLVAKVPVVGTPVDLYVEGNTAYVVVSDAFYYGWGPYALEDGADIATTPWIGSQVWAVDVSTPAQPHVQSVLPVDGSVSETRIVGNVLYVVSNLWSWYEWDWNGGGSTTFVQSFDIANPSSMQSVQRLDFSADGWDIHANVTENRIVLSESGWNYDPDAGTDTELTQFAPIDISDPAGALRLGALFSTPGAVSDRWAMDFDATTGLFRAVVQNQSWGNAGGSLQIWSAPTVDSATAVGSLDLNISEQITAASFDGPRAYIVSSYCTDPLWIIDTTDPTHPAIQGSVQMSGALDFILPRGNQLLALGHDSSGCAAWEGVGQLAVSLFDVTDPTHPVLSSRVDFGQEYSYIDVSADDMKKAFQVLDPLSMILVPFQSWDQTNWSYAGGTQLIDFNAQSLTLRGFAPHAGDIKRAFPVQDKLVALSDRNLQVLDASDRDHPATVATLDLARPVISLAVVGNQTVELSGDWSLGDTELAVTDASSPDQAVPAATVDLAAPYARMFQDGNTMWILAQDYSANTAWLQAVDISNPAQPTPRGRLDLDPSTIGYVSDGYWSWGYGAEAVLVGHALVLHNEFYGCWDYCGSGYQQPSDTVQVINLADVDHPTVSAPVQLDSSDWSWGLTAVGNDAWITHYEWVSSGSNGWVRYYVDRIDVSNPAQPQLLQKINVPGVFFSASADGQTIYTQDVTWTSNWSNATTVLNKLMVLSTGQALLLGTTTLPGYPDGAVIDGDRAYLETWDWSTQNYQASLVTVDLPTLAVTSTQQIGSSWSWLRKVAGGKLFVQADWYDQGILVYDLANPDQPAFQGSVRTEGWVNDIVVSGNTAYLPSGDYGVPMLDLTPGSPLPSAL